MGSNFTKQMCCVTCERCKKQEEEEGGNEETRETKPILQSSGEETMFTDTQHPTPALRVPRQGSKDVQSLSQDEQPSVEEKVDPSSAAEGWEAAWNPMDFFAAPAEEETEVEVPVLTQADNQKDKASNTEKREAILHAPEAWSVAHPFQGAELVAEGEQPKEQEEPGREGILCAGVTLQEGNILNIIAITSETASGQDSEIRLPVETGVGPTGRNLPLHTVQMAEESEPYLSAEHVEEADRANIAEARPQSTTELAFLVETLTLLTMQPPVEVKGNGMVEVDSPSAMPWKFLYPILESLEPENQLQDLSEQESQSSVPSAQGMGSLGCAEPERPSCTNQSSVGVLPEEERSMQCEAEAVAGEAEPQHRLMQQTELPEEPVTFVPVAARQEGEFPNVAPLLSEVPGDAEEIEVENVEA